MNGVWQACGTSRQRRPGSDRTYIEIWNSGTVNLAVVSIHMATETREVDEVSLETKEKKKRVSRRRALAMASEAAEVVRQEEA